jgi:hypothetical protein
MISSLFPSAIRPVAARAVVINTRLQPGVITVQAAQNRFSGFTLQIETIETVSSQCCSRSTRLKPGVNEMSILEA